MNSRIPDGASSRPAYTGLPWLLHPVADKDDAPAHVEQWGHAAGDFEPGKPKGIERPGIGTKEENQGFIVSRM